jgi:acyl-CoA synthetase (AMP-forming)/AMP-acid ligase II
VTSANGAAHAALTPLRFLERASAVFPDRVGIVDGPRRITYREFAAEANRLANALAASGVEPGARVAYLCPNSAPMLIAHFAVPLAGAVLVAINTRLSPDEVKYICDHSGAEMIVVDHSLLSIVDEIEEPFASVKEVVSVGGDQSGRPNYEELLARGSDEARNWTVDDENATITINYTSGTTGRPKGVMYTHRGAYLNALGEVVHHQHSSRSVYLWTLPMFHCNGWCTTWGVTAVAGRHVCLEAVRGEEMWRLIDEEEVTHLSGAPVVLSTLVEGSAGKQLPGRLVATIAGAPPSPTIIEALETMGADLIHVYGLTETYGPYTVCEPQDHWSKLDGPARARLLSRQGVGMVQAERARVVDADMKDVPADGITMGEIVMRGNNVMKGYFADEQATADAFEGGWFHSGDLGVMHPDGYVQLLDRAKDVVISGGENISTVEIEQALLRHEAVADVAVVAMPDPKWGEVPKAFVVLRAGSQANEADLIAFAREHVARFKAPKSVEFVAELPRTSTGKVQKFDLREREWAGYDARIKG